jgi:hypothetical protein
MLERRTPYLNGRNFDVTQVDVMESCFAQVHIVEISPRQVHIVKLGTRNIRVLGKVFAALDR